MRKNNLVGVHLRRPHKTTIKDPGAQVCRDLANLDFTSNEVGALYVGDITYLPYGKEGKFLYVTTVLDVCSRRLVGWSIADHTRTDLVVEALESAAAARVRWPVLRCTRIMACSTRRRSSRPCAGVWAWCSRWDLLVQVRIIRWPSRSTLR